VGSLMKSLRIISLEVVEEQFCLHFSEQAFNTAYRMFESFKHGFRIISADKGNRLFVNASNTYEGFSVKDIPRHEIHQQPTCQHLLQLDITTISLILINSTISLNVYYYLLKPPNPEPHGIILNT
jgi:hypothetical protein